MEYTIEDYVFYKGFVTSVRNSHLQTYDTNHDYSNYVTVHNSCMALTNPNNLVSVERLKKECKVGSKG